MKVVCESQQLFEALKLKVIISLTETKTFFYYVLRQLKKDVVFFIVYKDKNEAMLTIQRRHLLSVAL